MLSRINKRFSGITLLEVLISMFVMLVGLLGVMSMIPVGRFEQQRGAKIDRASACGRAAFREMKVRGMLNPTTWAKPNADADRLYVPSTHLFSYTGTTWAATDAATPLPLVPGGSGYLGVVVDPLGIAAGFNYPVPYRSTADSARLPRITFGPFGSAEATKRAALADSVFRWQDDLKFDDSGSSESLPRQVMQGTAKRLSEGDYSWLATIVPNPELVNGGNAFDVSMRVSVAVFYKRDLVTAGAGERLCSLEPPTGTGETALTVLSTDTDLTATPYSGDASKYLDAKPGQWLMIATTRTASPNELWHYNWYRVVAIDKLEGDGTTTTPFRRAVTLAGPDQQFFSSPGRSVAFLFDGIIAVYEKNMKLELDSIY